MLLNLYNNFLFSSIFLVTGQERFHIDFLIQKRTMLSELLSAFNIKTRSSRLRELADELGIPYTRRMTFRNLPPTVQGFRVFRNKRFRRIRNILSLEEKDMSGDFKLFDFYGNEILFCACV